MIRAILFDRDGTLGELVDSRYPASLRPYAPVREVFDRLKQMGYKIGIVTNQASIARGTGKNYDFDAEFTAFGADVWEICPHDEGEKCPCQKPSGFMARSAAKRLGVPTEECLMIGDRITDVQCALDAGAKAGLVLTGRGERDRAEAERIAPDLLVVPVFSDLPGLLGKAEK